MRFPRPQRLEPGGQMCVALNERGPAPDSTRQIRPERKRASVQGVRSQPESQPDEHFESWHPGSGVATPKGDRHGRK